MVFQSKSKDRTKCSATHHCSGVAAETGSYDLCIYIYVKKNAVAAALNVSIMDKKLTESQIKRNGQSGRSKDNPLSMKFLHYI